jgi:hypothetical protein
MSCKTPLSSILPRRLAGPQSLASAYLLDLLIHSISYLAWPQDSGLHKEFVLAVVEVCGVLLLRLIATKEPRET